MFADNGISRFVFIWHRRAFKFCKKNLPRKQRNIFTVLCLPSSFVLRRLCLYFVNSTVCNILKVFFIMLIETFGILLLCVCVCEQLTLPLCLWCVCHVTNVFLLSFILMFNFINDFKCLQLFCKPLFCILLISENQCKSFVFLALNAVLLKLS